MKLESDEQSIPRLYAAASLKPVHRRGPHQAAMRVFRGFMPRPH